MKKGKGPKKDKRQAWKPGARYEGTCVTDRCVAAVRNVTRGLDPRRASHCYHASMALDRLRATCR